MRLALKADGLFMAVMAGGQTLQNLHECFMSAETEIYGGATARIHPFASLQSMAGLMQRAGFALPVVDHDVMSVDYRALTTLFHDLRAMGETSILKHAPHHYRPKRFFDRVEDIYKAQHGNADGTMPVAFELIYLHGWAPHESQQQPLRPGSAETSLTEVL
jgi:NADH dehydrogenase [ubiquinone] 1 alpha subcomplex assembly factor 5